MSKCYVKGLEVFHVGDWDYQKVLVENLIEQPESGVASGEYWIFNPVPFDVIERNIPLSWTEDQKIVTSDNPLARTPYE